MASGGSDCSATGSTRPISREQAERNTYGGMTSRQLLGGDKNWLGTLGVYNGPYGNDGGGEAIPDYQAPIPTEIVKSGDVFQRLDKIFGIAPKSIVAQQTQDLAAGVWEGIKAIPGGLLEGAKTVADGYRGLGYLVTGNISSFQPRSNITFNDLARGVVEYSPVGVLRGMLDNNYRVAGNRLAGTVVGLGTSYAMPYLNKVPGLNYDVGAAGARGLYAMGEYAAGKVETILDRSGLRMYAVEPGQASSGRIPRVDVTDDFILKSGKNGSATLRFGDPQGVHGLIVNVDKNGVLGFDIRAPQGGSSFSSASGTDMFLSAMQRLDQEGVQVSAIRGTWVEGTDSVNSAQYLNNLNKGMLPQQAAANTWTGRLAASQGYTNVGVPKTSFNRTTVIFGR
jgi:hypothetical protein